MPCRKALINTTSPKMTQKEYDLCMEKFYREFPFYSVQGKLSPYTNTVIDTWHDYMLYGHCYVMKQITENRLSSMDDQYHDQISDLERKAARSAADLRAANKTCADLSAQNKKLQSSNGLLASLFSILLVVLVCILFVVPNPLEDDLAALKKENEELQDSLLAAEAEVDQSYRDGLSAGYRINTSDDSPIERPAYSFSHSYDSSPAVETYYIGNRSTKKFHRSDCSYLPAQDNQVALSSREEAISSGYDPCKRCDP